MASVSFSQLRAGLLLAGVSLAVAGCQSGMTYGTGTTPAIQTVQDIVGIAALSNEPKEPIDYQPRPSVVTPPVVGQLPPPIDKSQTQMAANWPNDPDVLRAQVRADAAAREASGEATPFFRTPAAPEVKPMVPTDRPWTKEETAQVQKAFADARAIQAVDENGNPVRRYLSDPPVEYRMPDPNAPVDIAEKPKPKRKFKWWWEN